MATPRNRKRCIGCGAIMPARGAAKAGWTVSRCCCPRLGSRWYRQCGCLPSRQYQDMVRHLFTEGLDYTRRIQRLIDEEADDGAE